MQRSYSAAVARVPGSSGAEASGSAASICRSPPGTIHASASYLRVRLRVWVGAMGMVRASVTVMVMVMVGATVTVMVMVMVVLGLAAIEAL